MSDALDTSVEGMVTMQERVVNIINQLSIVVGRHIAGLSRSLDAHIEATGQVFNERITTPWPIEEGSEGDVSATFDLEKIFKIIDEDRMDILSTLIRVTLIEIEATLAEGLLALRPWEALSRSQLARAQGPGQLFSPLEIPEDW